MSSASIMRRRGSSTTGTLFFTGEDGVTRVAVMIEHWPVEHPGAPATVGVRGKSAGSFYLLKMGGDGQKTFVQVDVIDDPGGMIPSWIVNAARADWPATILNGIRRQVRERYVESHALPQVENGPWLDWPE